MNGRRPPRPPPTGRSRTGNSGTLSPSGIGIRMPRQIGDLVASARRDPSRSVANTGWCRRYSSGTGINRDPVALIIAARNPADPDRRGPPRAGCCLLRLLPRGLGKSTPAGVPEPVRTTAPNPPERHGELLMAPSRARAAIRRPVLVRRCALQLRTPGHAEMSTSFTCISMRGTEYSLTLARPCRRSPRSIFHRSNASVVLLGTDAITALGLRS